jgi:FPC/CPF motif-containing protein YcgG
MKEVSAVEWLIEKLDNNLDINHSWRTRQYIQQAKEIFEEQITEAWNSAYGGDSNHEGEQYYKETYQDTK